MNVLRRTALGFLGLLIFSAVVAPVCAQQEFPPPRGKGRVVVVISGHDGAPAYRGVAQEIAQLGYDVVLFDANSIATRLLACRCSDRRRAVVAVPGTDRSLMSRFATGLPRPVT